MCLIKTLESSSQLGHRTFFLDIDRDKDTGKSRGFAFLAYEDQRSTVLAVDNLSGARVAGRVIKVDHVDNYKIKRAEARALNSTDCTSLPDLPSIFLDLTCCIQHFQIPSELPDKPMRYISFPT